MAADLRAQTQANLQAADQRLDALVDITGQQKIVAVSIGSELDAQNKMLRQVDEHMDATQVQLTKTNALVKNFKENGTTWGGWILAILLVASIVVVWVVN
jgi:syntaxin 8